MKKNFDYDAKYDVLYIAVGDMSNSYGEEDPDGIVVHRDMTTEEITGITVFDFSKRIHGAQDLHFILPASVDFDKEIKPLLH